MFSKIIYLAGTLIRNKKIFRNYGFLLKSQDWDIKTLQNHQFQMLRALLDHAYQHSEYYKKKFQQLNILPDSIKSLEDLNKIPILTKQELLQNSSTIQIKSGSEKLFYSETSGSTGKPLVFYRNMDWDAWHRASVYRGYHWYGVKPWDRNGYLWGYNLSPRRRIKTRFLDLLQNRFRLFSYKDDEIDVFINKLKKASFLGGYSSMIYEIAKKVNTKKPRPEFSLKMVKGTSEKIFEKYQVEVQRAFGRKIISEYGAAEAGIIAFECPFGNMHMNMETVLVEEENNEIIVTNLVSKSFPIIRFKLGDYVEIDRQEKCRCGMQHYIIKDVLGRVGKVIYGYKDQYPSLTLYYVFKNLAMEHDLILNYLAIQSQRGHLKVEVENGLTSPHLTLLINEFKKYFQDDLDVQIFDNMELKSANKKKTDFISEL
ncbi:MAG: hypothetical protein WAO55_10430 [Candidatus Manganitrophaceae bacterium]